MPNETPQDEWSGPLQPPPFWLRPEMEVTDRRPPLNRGEFVVACITSLRTLGLSIDQALDVAANTISEVGWDMKFRAWNLGGVKITKATSRNSDGSPRLWWRALGHKKSGDAHTCFYRAYPSLAAYFESWLKVFVPRAPNTGRYGETGARFWAGLDWFPALIEAGYKGEVTKEHPDASIRAHESIAHELAEYWAQHLLGGLTVDGAWGPKSKERCKEWQEERGLEPTGLLDEATRALLFRA